MNLKVSVCIPTYNQANYIEQAIRSASEQEPAPYEIIVSDDCSTDGTLLVLERLQTEIKTLKVLKQPTNTGIARNTDFCLRSAEGDYIVRLDSDDYLSSGFCNILSRKLEQSSDAGYAHAAVQEVDENSNPKKIRKLYRVPGFETAEHALQAAIKGYRVAANILMFRKSALVAVDYITGRPEYVEDYHLSASLAAAGYGNVYSDKVLSNYRVWTDTGKVRQKRKLAEIIGLRRVFEDVLQLNYHFKGWNETKLIKSKEQFACNHAECLGWAVYTETEKDELQQELYNLADTHKVRLYSKLFRSGFGKPVLFLKKSIGVFKSKVKNVLK